MPGTQQAPQEHLFLSSCWAMRSPHPTQGSEVRDVESQEPEPGVGPAGGSLTHLSVLPDRNNRLAEEAAFRESFCRGRSEGDEEEEEFLRGLGEAERGVEGDSL